MDLALLKVMVEQQIPFNRFLGLEMAHAEPGRVRLELPFRDEFLGDWTRAALHGGVISMVADVAGGISIWSTLESPSLRVSTIDLRVDPNAAWSVPDSIRAGIALEELDLEYLEDPCIGIEGMSQVRAKVRIPLCTNMCLVRFEDFAPAVRLGAVDVVHGDVYKWGGIAPTKALAAHCETFGLGMNLHSGGELGIATAAHLAIVASTPVLSRAIDSMYYLHSDDIIEPLTLRGGRLTVPTGPGLGVTVDEDKLHHYAEVNAREGDLTR